ncbi:MAG: hypothetical protein L3K19_00250 [Thermoplasmata archaeon]|nr:hypothetical protein [Thermoplasmata archaeon]
MKEKNEAARIAPAEAVEDPEFEVIIRGPGVSVERKVGRLTAQRAVVVILGDGTTELPPMSPSPTQLGPETIEGDSPSLREYWTRLRLDSNPAKIAAIGAHSRAYHRKPTFSRDDLRAAFVSAGEPMPRNLPRDIKKAVRAGYIAPSPGNDAGYYVTATGLALLRPSESP